jgi:site-specific DNA-methyltransferase (adenine-specific)
MLTWVYRSGFPKGGDLSKLADKRAGAEREVVGVESRLRHRPITPNWKRSMALPTAVPLPGCRDNPGMLRELTAPATPLAVALDGWFTKGKVKPAVEVIIWARKPISEKTELDNMVRWGVGGVNCGACMVPFESDAESTLRPLGRSAYQKTNSLVVALATRSHPVASEWAGGQTAGRYPANLLVTDDALGAGTRYFDVDRWAEEHGYTEDGWADAAAAGMLQIAKPSRAEKNAGCEGLPEVEKRVLSGGQLPYPEGESWDAANRRGAPSTNPHPTCKPVRLFAYLLDFLCPAGGTVLDPFLGSGTTLVAAAQTGRRGTGIELEPDYFPIAEARVRHAMQQQREATEAQLTLDAMASA